jgi:hypothetical protein
LCCSSKLCGQVDPKNKGTIEGCEGRLQNALATGGWALPA